jgi:hypothetical protein
MHHQQENALPEEDSNVLTGEHASLSRLEQDDEAQIYRQRAQSIYENIIQNQDVGVSSNNAVDSLMTSH